MRAKKYYKNDIKVFTENIVLPSFTNYENDNIKIITNPDPVFVAQIRSIFFDVGRKLSIDFNSLNFEIIHIHRQHYHLHSIRYAGNSIELIDDRYYDHPDFILLKDYGVIALGMKTTSLHPLSFTLTLYELQPLILFVAEFSPKNFSSNPTAKGGLSPYATGISGLDPNGDIVMYAKFSQPLKIDESYVYIQKLLIPSYSGKIPPHIIVPPDIHFPLFFPNITTSGNVSFSLYYPDITTSGDVSFSLYYPDITTQNVSFSIYYPDITTENVSLSLHYPDITTSGDVSFSLYHLDIITQNVGITLSKPVFIKQNITINHYKPIITTSGNFSISIYYPDITTPGDINLVVSDYDAPASLSSSEIYYLNTF